MAKVSYDARNVEVVLQYLGTKPYEEVKELVKYLQERWEITPDPVEEVESVVEEEVTE